MLNSLISEDNLSIALNGRKAVFNLLSKVFADIPSAETDPMIQEVFKGILPFACFTGNPDMLAGIDMLVPENIDGDYDITITADPIEDRARDYTWLFLSGRGSIPLNESVYLSPERILMQEPWAEVKLFYCQNRIKCLPGSGIVEDHIAAELGFMSITSAKAAECCRNHETDAMINILKVQNEFYKDHIMRWFAEVWNRVIERKDRLNSAYYVVFAYILKGYLNEDYKFVCELISE